MWPNGLGDARSEEKLLSSRPDDGGAQIAGGGPVGPVDCEHVDLVASEEEDRPHAAGALTIGGHHVTRGGGRWVGCAGERPRLH